MVTRIILATTGNRIFEAREAGTETERAVPSIEMVQQRDNECLDHGNGS